MATTLPWRRRQLNDGQGIKSEMLGGGGGGGGGGGVCGVGDILSGMEGI